MATAKTSPNNLIMLLARAGMILAIVYMPIDVYLTLTRDWQLNYTLQADIIGLVAAFYILFRPSASKLDKRLAYLTFGFIGAVIVGFIFSFFYALSH